MIKDIAAWLAILAATSSASVGIYAAAFLKVRDKFIEDLARQSEWAAIAATLAGVSALAQVVEKWPA